MAATPTLPKKNEVHTLPPPEPRIVDHETWLRERQALLAAEKDATRAYDSMMEKRRALPWTPVEQDYEFERHDGSKVKLSELFKDERPLFVQHVMWAPDWPKLCLRCSFWLDEMNGVLPHLSEKMAYVAICNVDDLEKMETVRKQKGWGITLLSARSNSFNDDFQVHQSPADIAEGKPMKYNFTEGPNLWKISEYPGFSVFVKHTDGKIYRTYSAYARGMEAVSGLFGMLDCVPGGRFEFDPKHKEDIPAERYAPL